MTQNDDSWFQKDDSWPKTTIHEKKEKGSSLLLTLIPAPCSLSTFITVQKFIYGVGAECHRIHGYALISGMNRFKEVKPGRKFHGRKTIGLNTKTRKDARIRNCRQQ
jgi:hypothetical protein